MILPAGAFLTLGLMLGFANLYIEHRKNLERDSLIAQYKRVGKEEITDDVLKEAGV
jgi:electron transport complex protein RnfE